MPQIGVHPSRRVAEREGSTFREQLEEAARRACVRAENVYVRTVRGARALRVSEHTRICGADACWVESSECTEAAVCVRTRVGSQGEVRSHRLCGSHMGRTVAHVCEGQREGLRGTRAYDATDMRA